MTIRDARGRFTRPRHRAEPAPIGDRREPSRARHLHAWDEPAELRGCPSCTPRIYSERAARHRADTSSPNDTTRHQGMT